jgi:hypothetical protein
MASRELPAPDRTPIKTRTYYLMQNPPSWALAGLMRAP